MEDNDPIQVAIGIADKTHGEPICYWLFDNGVKFGGEYTRADLIQSRAVLLDLADAIAHKLRTITN